MTEEDEEFQRLEREVEMRRRVVRRMAEEDDDIQVYKKPWVGLTDEERNALLHLTITHSAIEFGKAIEDKLKEKNA